MPGKNRARTRRYLRLVLAGVAAVFLIAATACSSGSGSAGSSGGTSGTAAASAASTLKGTPLNVMTIASVNYAGPTYKNILVTAQVAGDWINAHGGIDGHPVNVTTCDEQGDPTRTAQCGRQAIQDHDVAVIGSFTFNGNAIIPELAAAHISWFGICCAAASIEFTSPDVQQIGDDLTTAPGLAVKMVQDGCKHIALVELNTGSTQLGELIVENALKSVHASGALAKIVKVPLTAQDYSPQVAQATSGTDCILAGLGQANFPSFMPPFMQSGAHQRLYGAQGNLDITVTKAYPQATENAVIAGVYSDISLPAWADFRAALKQFNAPTDLNYNSLAGLGTWAAYVDFVKIAQSLKGPINAANFLAAAQTATVNLPGMVPSFSFADKYTALGGQYLTSVNRAVTFDVAHNGVPVPWDGGKFFDMSNAMVGQPLTAANTPPPGES